MKKEDLRIGNYYYSVKFGKAVECDLSDFYDLCANSYGATDDPPIDNMFEPIPLTDEWLIKLGALRVDYSDIYTLGTYHIFEDGEYYFYDDWSDFQFAKVKYVHQLQNLYYALTGEELKIEAHKPKPTI